MGFIFNDRDQVNLLGYSIDDFVKEKEIKNGSDVMEENRIKGNASMNCEGDTYYHDQY